MSVSTIKIIPIIYDTLPEPEKFLGICSEIAKMMNQNELFQFHELKTEIAKDLMKYTPYLVKGVIPPKETRYNSMNGWLSVDSKIRSRLGLLKTDNCVGENSKINYPGLAKEDIIIGIIPADVRTTQEIYNEESHFNTHGALWGMPEKTEMLVYHIGILDAEGNVIDSKYKEQKLDQIAYSLIDVIAKEILGVDDILMEIVRIKFGYQKKEEGKKDDLFERLRVLFYGNDICSFLTLKKAILLFDDIHFCDRPSINVGGNWGTIGRPSRIRKFVYTLARDNIPVLVHNKMPSSIYQSLDESIAYEIGDKDFSKIVYDHFKNDLTFRHLLVQPNANYAKGKGSKIIDSMLALDLGDRLYALEDYRNTDQNWYDPNSEKSMAEVFAHSLIEISAKLTMACAICFENDLIPFTEYPVFEQLLALRYNRALKQDDVSKLATKIKLVHLSQKIFDSIIPDEILDRKSMEEVIKYRKETRKPYESFRKYLMSLNYQIESNVFDGKFEQEVKKILVQEVIPKADEFKNECQRIWEKMFGEIIKELSKKAPLALSSFIIYLYSGMSWFDILAKGCAIYSILHDAVPPIVDYALEKRNLERCNSLSYLMQFSK